MFSSRHSAAALSLAASIARGASNVNHQKIATKYDVPWRRRDTRATAPLLTACGTPHAPLASMTFAIVLAALTQYTFLGDLRSYERTVDGLTVTCAPGATLRIRLFDPSVVRVTLDRPDRSEVLLESAIASHERGEFRETQFTCGSRAGATWVEREVTHAGYAAPNRAGPTLIVRFHAGGRTTAAPRGSERAGAAPRHQRAV